MDHRELRFGYGAGTQMQSLRQLLDEAEWAHSVGFESFWLSQVFGLDPIVALAALGGHVPRFRELGTSVVPPRVATLWPSEHKREQRRVHLMDVLPWVLEPHTN